ncbi:O-antigen ligase family protein [Sphingopyxis sp.]|uniref:O-antigen ligase family protein n=1 Tax=Sphingopyxis sp. TaxID=1908224 RepID=UPI002EDA6D8B
MNNRTRTLAAAPQWDDHLVLRWAPVAFLVMAFLLGGGSRSDTASMPFLRGGAVLFAFWAAAGLRAEDWRRIRVPLLLLLALSLWMAIQLIPLPPQWWQALPGREPIAAIDHLVGLADLWRPISLTPSLTWNSLLSMTVPFAALFVTARVHPNDYPLLIYTLVALAGIGALLGLVQILSGAGSAAYLYRITNEGMMVGLFANRNHHALFLALAVVLAAMLMRDEYMKSRRDKLTVGVLGFVIVLLTITTALIGSRSGFVAGVIAFSAGYAMILLAMRTKDQRPGRGQSAARSWQRAFAYAPPLLLIGLLVTVLSLSSRISAIDRASGADLAGELRVQAWPTVRAMAETYWGTGSGFGSFAGVYKMFEPDALLSPSYFNHAHNDWIELVITGGLPFILVAFATLVWLGRKFAAAGTRNLVKGYRGDYRFPVLVIAGLFVMVSFVDYPLRMPSLQVMAILLIVLFCCPRNDQMNAPN